MSLIVTSKYVDTWGVTHLAPQIAPMLKRRCIWHSSDEPMGGRQFNRCSWFLQNSFNSSFLWVLSSFFILLGLFTSSLGSRNVHLIKALVPLIALSFDHQNHSKWHKWCHVRYTRLHFLDFGGGDCRLRWLFSFFCFMLDISHDH